MAMTPLRSKALLDILGILALSVYLTAPFLAGDPGVGWHLKTGEWIFQHRAIPYTDPFLSTSGDKLWVANQWLSDVILYWLYSQGGWGLLGGSLVSLAGFSYLCLLPKWTESSVPHISAPAWLAGMLLVILLGSLQWFVRPVIFSFVIFIFVFSRISRSALSKFDWISLPLVFILWANMHSAFPLGWLAIAISALSFLPEKNRTQFISRIALLLLCVAVTLINPYGIALHANILTLVGEPYFMSLNAEWLAPDFHVASHQALMYAALVLIAGLALGARLSLFQLLSTVVFISLAFQGRRYIPFFAVIGAAPILLCTQSILNAVCAPLQRFQWAQAFLEPAHKWRFGYIPTMAACVGLVVILTARGGTGPENLRQKEAIEAVKATGSSGAIFHTPNIGGYMTFLLWPGQRAWIDDRNELNGKEIYQEYFKVVKLEPGWDSVVNKYNFEFLIFDNPSAPATFFREQKNWSVLFENSKSVVFRKQ